MAKGKKGDLEAYTSWKSWFKVLGNVFDGIGKDENSKNFILDIWG